MQWLDHLFYGRIVFTGLKQVVPGSKENMIVMKNFIDFAVPLIRPNLAMGRGSTCWAGARCRPAYLFWHLAHTPTNPDGTNLASGRSRLWPRTRRRPVPGAEHRGAGRGLPAVSSRTYLDVIRANPADHTHVLLMRTPGKFGLAGVRPLHDGSAGADRRGGCARPPHNVSVL